eukprot:CAMPEP_0113639346 /NCGR_PEP_ID=MMETSP0017_2-20120614/20640_1 /TAXON_ID=2856 /ORGANISM="Cylindrotheca closterium" /LENGTH=244 /DNA_ID=CAMNT_0000550553 /DNA_START=212 /DNA_END=946 /DNA_ORIENTATION=- /assembly_acc=CAM_ASM_000147
MNSEDEDNEHEDESQSLEMKRHRSRQSSKRTREKEKSLMDELESKRNRLYASNAALRYHSCHLREAIQSIKMHMPNIVAPSTENSSLSPPSENSNVESEQNGQQYNQNGTTAPPQLLQNSTNPTIAQQQLQQMVPSLPTNLNPLVAQANPLLPAAAASLNHAGILQSIQHQASLQTALHQAEMNRRMVAGAPLTNFPVSQVFLPQPVNLAAAAAAAVALNQWLPPPEAAPESPREDDKPSNEKR